MESRDGSPFVKVVCRRGLTAARKTCRKTVTVTITFDLGGFQLTIPLHIAQASQAHVRVHRQKRPLSAATSNLTTQGSNAGSLDASVTTTDEVVAELRRRLSQPDGPAPSGDATATGSASTHERTPSSTAGDSPAARLARSGEALDDACILRWLTARQHDVDLAERDLKEHIAWRTAYIPQGRVLEEEVAREISTQKAYLQGCDHQARPVLIILARRHDMSARVPEETNRFIVYTLDSCAAAVASNPNPSVNPLGKFLCLFDLSGLRMNNLDFKALQGVFSLLQGHFPERLSQLWFLNAPFIFWGLWRCMSPFIEPATRDKIVFLSGAERAARLNEVIPYQVLPVEYGGQAEMIPVEMAVAAQREASAAAAAAKPQRQSQKPRGRQHQEQQQATAIQGPQRWASSALGYVRRGTSSLWHLVTLPTRHLPALGRPGLPAWIRGSSNTGRTGMALDSPRASLALVRQHSMALQRRVASSLDTVPGLFVILAPVLHPAEFLCTVWRRARQVARWAWSKTPTIRGQTKAKVPRDRLYRLEASVLDGGLAPRHLRPLE